MIQIVKILILFSLAVYQAYGELENFNEIFNRFSPINLGQMRDECVHESLEEVDEYSCSQVRRVILML